MSELDLRGALTAAIPGLSLEDTPLAPPHGEDSVTWLETLLGEDFCCYVEWKEFDSWGIDALKALIPIRSAGIALSIDSVYDAEGMPVSDDCDEPFELFMPVLSEQLAPKHLQLLEICTIEQGQILAAENPRLVCTTTDPQAIEQLNQCLSSMGLCLC